MAGAPANITYRLEYPQPQSSSSDSNVELNEEVSEDFKKIVRSFLTNFKSPNWTQNSVCMPMAISSNLRSNLEFIAGEASHNGLSATLVKTGNDKLSLCISKSKSATVFNLSFLQLTPTSENLLQLLFSQIYIPGKPSKHVQNTNNSCFKIEGGVGSRLQANRKWKVPKCRVETPLNRHAQCLPIYNYKDTILNSVMQNTFTLIKGGPGCGKSTQVPQFILDEATKENKHVQIIATVPHRVTAIFVAERIATERGEEIGTSVGYQVRLESRVSPCDTVLTFCTNEILLRSLSQPDYDVLKNTTHIIVDDINVRDQYMDFLLTCLRDLLPVFPKLRIILMGVDININSLTIFFRPFLGNSVISVYARPFPVSTYFMEDIIRMTSHLLQSTDTIHAVNYNTYRDEEQAELKNNCVFIDDLMENVFKFACKESATKLINFVISQNISVNYQHSDTKISILSCFAVSGFTEEVKLMLKMGADPELISDSSDSTVDTPFVGKFTARDFATESNMKETIDQFTEHQVCKTVSAAYTLQNLKISDPLQHYGNYPLSTHVVNIIHEIHRKEDRCGAILVLLKDYDEIIEVMDKLFFSTNLNTHEFSVFLLHSEMQSGDQNGVFKSSPVGVRKVILATDICETSLTFPDVCFVVDTGKNSKKIWSDCDSTNKIETQWISKSSAKQREALAGNNRPGKCFKVYSTSEYEAFSEFTLPSILTSSLLHLCLLCRSLIRLETKISTFFHQVPNPPDPSRVERTVKILQDIEALDADDESLTLLGNHMIDYPIEPQLTKALFYGIVMKCIDPVLTIVAALHHGDPFLNSSENTPLCHQSIKYKRMLGKLQHSDHYAIVKLFQEWETETFVKNGSKFCANWGLRVSTFEKICTSRTMLLAQLRASGFVKNDIRDLNQHSKHWVMVKAVLTAARYPNIGKVDRLSETINLGFPHNYIGIHPSAVIAKDRMLDLKSEWIIFDESLSTDSYKQIKGCTVVTPVCVALFGGGLFRITRSNTKGSCSGQPYRPNDLCINISDRIAFQGTESSIQLIGQLRMNFRILLSKVLKNPLGQTSTFEAGLIRSVAEVLHQEEHKIGLENEDVSQWPKFVGANMMTLPQIGYKSPMSGSSSSCSLLLRTYQST